MEFERVSNYYPFRIAVSLLIALLAGVMWTLVLIGYAPFNGLGNPLFGAIFCTLLLPLVLYWQYRLYRHHVQKVLFMLDAMENNDNTIHFSEAEHTTDSLLVNQALNRVAHILYNVKSETVQQEKYYELILDCVNTGIIVLNDHGAVYQKNSEALRLLGLNIFTHVTQLTRVDSRLADLLTHCRSGNKLQVPFSNERGTVNLSIRVSNITVRKEHLRILALNDINSELDEMEIDSWIRLTRVLTHEIMNAVTPITSLSDTLLAITTKHTEDSQNQKGKTDAYNTKEEIRNGLQTISSTGKGLLAFVESYRKFTRIPTPEPSLFYVKSFIERMVELARHQYPDVRVEFLTNITPNDLILYADENLITQVVVNLLKNAMQALESDKTPDKKDRICIQAYCNEAEAIFIEISNTGPEIPQDIAEHLFIPFFTTKEKGSGIGLSISRQIMRLSGGSISLLPGKETTFVLKFN